MGSGRMVSGWVESVALTQAAASPEAAPRWQAAGRRPGCATSRQDAPGATQRLIRCPDTGALAAAGITRERMTGSFNQALIPRPVRKELIPAQITSTALLG